MATVIFQVVCIGFTSPSGHSNSRTEYHEGSNFSGEVVYYTTSYSMVVKYCCCGALKCTVVIYTDVVLGEAVDSELRAKKESMRKLFKTCCMNWGEVIGGKLIQLMHTTMVPEQVKTKKIQAGVQVLRLEDKDVIFSIESALDVTLFCCICT
ncbi:hypothetical protein Tco_1217281 [Tanacetum coccineum]